MIIPSGYTENQVLSCINYISNTLAPQFQFGYHSVEDLKQDCFVFCWEALPKYDVVKGKLSTFLMTVAKRKFINMRRNKLYRMPPKCDCEKCKIGNPCSDFIKKMKRWKKLNTSKRDIMEANHLEDKDYDILENILLDDIIENTEFNRIINEYLDIEYREDYKKILEGICINKKRREKIFEKIHEILGEFYD